MVAGRDRWCRALVTFVFLPSDMNSPKLGSWDRVRGRRGGTICIGMTKVGALASRTLVS
jgi:hypothetical protein